MTTLLSQLPQDTYGLIWYQRKRFIIAFHNLDDISFFKGPFGDVTSLASDSHFGLTSRDTLRNVYLSHHINEPEKAFITNYLALTE